MRQMTALRAVTATTNPSRPVVKPALDKLWDPAGTMSRLVPVPKTEAQMKNNQKPNKVVSEVLTGGHDAFSRSPARVLVNGFQEGALRYYLEK